MRMIDADELEKRLEEMRDAYELRGYFDNYIYGFDDAWKLIKDAPAIEGEPVRHGKWNYIDWGVAVCSMCKKRGFKRDYHGNDLPTKYCPNCGAKMDLEGNR